MSAEMFNFSLFENVPVSVGNTNVAPKIEEKQSRPELVPLRGNRAFFVRQRQGKLRAAAILFGFFLLASAICLQISGFAAIYETDKAIAQQKANIAVAKSEQVRLNAELDGKSSIENIEYFAESILGMKKPESFQVNYINLAKSDEVVLSGGQVYCADEPGFFSAIVAYFNSRLS